MQIALSSSAKKKRGGEKIDGEDTQYVRLRDTVAVNYDIMVLISHRNLSRDMPDFRQSIADRRKRAAAYAPPRIWREPAHAKNFSPVLYFDFRIAGSRPAKCTTSRRTQLSSSNILEQTRATANKAFRFQR